MEQRNSTLTKLIILIVQATSLLVLASLAFASGDSVQVLRVDMAHVDSRVDEKSLHTPERLRRAAAQSLNKAQVFARRAKSFSQAPVADLAPVYSGSDGAYLINLALGTPPQSFNGIFDTGSDLVWRQSSPCTECFQEPDPLFDPSKSSTYKTVPCNDTLCTALAGACEASECNYYYSYGDGSTTLGILSADTLSVGGTSVKSFAFGAGNDNYGNIGSVGTDGIVGMGGGPLSLISQMSSSIENKFSYCLVTWTDAPSTTSPLFLGSSANLTGPNVLSTRFVTNASIPTFYYLDLKGISVNGKLLNIPPGTFDLQPDGSGGVIIDSGTTLTILVDAAYSPIKDAYSSAINLPPVNGSSVGLDLCYDISNSATVDIPPLTFHFNGADVKLPSENIFISFEGYLCLAMIGIPTDQGFNINIYGNIQQQNFQLLFDKASANQLSFKPVNCETL